jgi:cytidylate kinase
VADAGLYDLVINVERFGQEKSVEQIVAALRNLFPDAEYLASGGVR